jgi:hypothetical protein
MMPKTTVSVILAALLSIPVTIPARVPVLVPLAAPYRVLAPAPPRSVKSQTPALPSRKTAIEAIVVIATATAPAPTAATATDRRHPTVVVAPARPATSEPPRLVVVHDTGRFLVDESTVPRDATRVRPRRTRGAR